MKTEAKALSIRARLILILALPILGLAVFAAITVAESLQIRGEARAARSTAEMAVAASHLIHEQQKERGLSAGFLASKGERFRGELASQRQVTDGALVRLRGMASGLREGSSVAKSLGPAVSAALAAANMQTGTARVAQGVSEAHRAGESMASIRAAAESVMRTVDEISSALREQSAASGSISSNVDKIASSSQEMSASVRGMATTANHLEALAGDLERSVGRFRLGA